MTALQILIRLCLKYVHSEGIVYQLLKYSTQDSNRTRILF